MQPKLNTENNCEHGDGRRPALQVAEEVAAMMQSPTFPSVLAFAKQMEAKLALNIHKGNRDGWLNVDPHYLLELLDRERKELQVAFESGNANWVAEECADVANFAMMLSDWFTARVQALKEPEAASPIENSQ